MQGVALAVYLKERDVEEVKIWEVRMALASRIGLQISTAARGNEERRRKCELLEMRQWRGKWSISLLRGLIQLYQKWHLCPFKWQLWFEQNDLTLGPRIDLSQEQKLLDIKFSFLQNRNHNFSRLREKSQLLEKWQLCPYSRNSMKWRVSGYWMDTSWIRKNLGQLLNLTWYFSEIPKILLIFPKIWTNYPSKYWTQSKTSWNFLKLPTHYSNPWN